MVFTANRPLLNPQFEGYKFSFSPSLKFAHVPLEHRATQSRPGTRALGFQEVSSRVRHNHLAVADSTNCAMYIADDGSVVLVRVSDDVDCVNGNEQWSGVILHVVFQLPPPQTVPYSQAQYPVAAHITRDLWFVSDGYGCAYLLWAEISSDSQATTSLLATWQFRLDNNLIPFQLHSVALVEPGVALAVLSSSIRTSPPSFTPASQAIFDIWAVRVPIPDLSRKDVELQGAMPVALDVVWCRHGDHIPLYVQYVPTHGASLLLGGSSYRNATSAINETKYEPTLDELAPIPRANEALDTSAPPPYWWTQTDDTVTVTFAVPGTTPTSSITATFDSRTLSLHVGNPPLPRPHYTAAPLWDAIRPALSLWTLERGESNKAGLLTLHFDKVHVGTRWSHIFTQGFESEVPETLDPSELAGILESLNKYTEALQGGASGVGIGVPSLASGERDNEVDSSVGTPVVLTWVDADGGDSIPVDDTSAVLLSLPLPGGPAPLTLVIKNDIDGPLYKLNDTPTWSHIATYPALAFVLASKRDTRFTFHISSTVVFAFESGARESGGGNVYLYHGSTPGDKWAKQSVFQMPAGVGALLGVGAISSGAGYTSLICLSEREITVCRGLL